MEIVKKEAYIKEKHSIYMSKSIYPIGFPEHLHEFLEIVYVTNGSGVHRINTRDYPALKGDVFLINIHMSHTFITTSSDFQMITCVFLPETIDEQLIHSENAVDILKLLLFKPFYGLPEDFLLNINLQNKKNEFDAILEDMWEEYQNRQKGYEGILQSYLVVLLTKIFRLASCSHEDQYSPIKKELVETAIHYLEQNYSKPLRLDEIARQVLLSPQYFASIFKSQTGLSLTDYIHKIRILEACRLLRDAGKSVQEVMREVGYQDSKFFYEIFKRYTGNTPGSYRKTFQTPKQTI